MIEDSFIGFSAFNGYIQLLPRLIILIFGLDTQDSRMFIFIFKLFMIKSNLFVLLAYIPPTIAAAFIIMSGLFFLTDSLV